MESQVSGFETLIYEKEDGIGYVTLNRPEALNAYNIRMRDELYEVLLAIRDDDEVRVVIFKGAGEKAFCAGGDVKGQHIIGHIHMPIVVKPIGLNGEFEFG